MCTHIRARAFVRCRVIRAPTDTFLVFTELMHHKTHLKLGDIFQVLRTHIGAGAHVLQHGQSGEGPAAGQEGAARPA